MIRNRLLLALPLIFMLLFSSLAAWAQNDMTNSEIPENFILQVGYFEFPGLTYTNKNGKAAGLVNDITTVTLDNAKIRYRIRAYPAARFYTMLAKGEIQLFNGLSAISVVRENTISSGIDLFPLEMRVYWIGDKNEISEKEELAGHSVILINGFTYKDWGAWIRDEKNKVVFYDTYTHESAFRMLKAGRAEYLLNYRYIDADILKYIPITDLSVKTLYRWKCCFNIHRNTPHAAVLLQKIENSYQELIQDGRLRTYE